MTIKIGQIILGNGRTALDEVRSETARRKLDDLLVQEPYIKDGRVPGFGVNDRVILGSCEKPEATVLVLNPEAVVLRIAEACMKHCADHNRERVLLLPLGVHATPGYDERETKSK